MNDDDALESQCPRCRKWVPDLDGFGVLNCPECGYCAHPCRSTDGAGVMRCDICNAAVERKRN